MENGEFPELSLQNVKGCEADPYSNGTFDPIHAEAFVQASANALCAVNED